MPGLCAKPVIDLVVELRPGADRGQAIAGLAELGYLHEGERGIPGREAFRWPEGEGRHHLYVTLGRPAELERMLAFRDYLRRHADVRDVYGALKVRLAERFRADRDGYTEAKTDFIEACLRAAGAGQRESAP